MATLEGRLVLITGASSGIGRAASRAFAVAGARVIGVARTRADLESLSAELGGPSCLLPLAADVCDPRAMEKMASFVLEQIGVPDVVVANAGIGLDALFRETSDADLHRIFDVNVYGLVRTVRPFVGPMQERASGRILFVSSIVGKRGIPHYSAYSASKFALHGMSEALRVELMGSGVSVGVVCPSSTTTEFQDRLLRSGPAQKRNRPRRHSPESVAKAIVSMARSRRREVVLGIEAKLLSVASRIVPGLIDQILARTLTQKTNDDAES